MDYKALRNTPGYTNYVPSIKKNIAGNITSAELKRYYANIDAQIFFNGEWVEDISDINWSINQQTMPLFGYNSYIWDDVAQGNRIINGSFIIAFTGPRNVNNIIENSSKSSSGSGTSFENEEKYLLDNKEPNPVINGCTIKDNPAHGPIWKWKDKKFDIDIMCGEKEANGSDPVHIVLLDCYIISSSQARMHAGGVASERYDFMARDIATIQ